MYLIDFCLFVHPESCLQECYYVLHSVFIVNKLVRWTLLIHVFSQAAAVSLTRYRQLLSKPETLLTLWNVASFGPGGNAFGPCFKICKILYQWYFYCRSVSVTLYGLCVRHFKFWAFIFSCVRFTNLFLPAWVYTLAPVCFGMCQKFGLAPVCFDICQILSRFGIFRYLA